jgi:hypothetical protein
MLAGSADSAPYSHSPPPTSLLLPKLYLAQKPPALRAALTYLRSIAHVLPADHIVSQASEPSTATRKP